MARADDFLDVYRELERTISIEYGLDKNESALIHLSNRPEFRSIKAELDYCRSVRNLLFHNPRINGVYSVEPSEEMVTLLKSTRDKILHPPRACNIEIPFAKLLHKSMYDCVRPAMIEMNRLSYTHIPILNNGILEGVFSENTLLSYLVDEEIVSIDRSMRFSDISKYLPIDAHTAETFRFVAQNALASDVSCMFEDALKEQDRIGMVFVTANGKISEKLLGVITAWDLAGAWIA